MKRMSTLLAGVLAVVAFGGIAQAETRLAVQDAGGTVDKMVVTDMGYVGVGTATPAFPVHVVGGASSAESTFEVRNIGGGTYNRYTTPTFRAMRNLDPAVNGGSLLAGDRIGYFSFGSYYGSSAKIAAAIGVEAATNFSATSYPGALTFYTTGPTDVNPIDRMKITATGLVGVGTVTPKQKLEVNGGVRLNTATVRPVCDANSRGTLWYTNGASLVADALEICFKEANNSYSWFKIH